MPILVSLVMAAMTTSASDQPRSESKCGGYCLYVALRALDLVEEPYSKFEKGLPAPPADGYSISDLETFAIGKGAKTLAIESDIETLGRLKGRRVCIALMGTHFVVIENVDVGHDLVSVLDPPYQYDQPLKKFQAKFSNRALVVSLDRIELPPPGPDWKTALSVGGISGVVGLSLIIMRYRAGRRGLALILVIMLGLPGCGVGSSRGRNAEGSGPPRDQTREEFRIEPRAHHAGKILQIDPERKIERTSVLHNDSSVPLHILEVRKSCACTSLALDRSTIPPGEMAKLTATFRLGNRPGPNRVAVELHTSYPGDHGTQLTYDWDLVTPLFANPAESKLGRLELGASASTVLELRNRGLALCRECGVEIQTENNILSGKFVTDPLLKRSDDPTHSGTALGTDSRLGSVFLESTGKAEPGDFAQSAEIILRCQGIDRARLSIPVSWSIRPAFEILPARLWLGSTTPGGKIKHRVLVRSNDETRFRVISVAREAGPLKIASDYTRDTETEKSVELTIEAPDRKGIHRGLLEVAIEGKNQPRIRLPISLVVGGIPTESGTNR